jgi:hypothetical protein
MERVPTKPLTRAQAVAALDVRINYLNTLIPTLSTYSRDIKEGIEPEYEPQDLIDGLSNASSSIISLIQRTSPIAVVVPVPEITPTPKAPTPRAAPKGAPVTPTARRRGVGVPRAKLEVISEDQQQQLLGSTFVSTGVIPRSPTARAVRLAVADYIRVVGFTEKQLIVERVPADPEGNIDELWLEEHPIFEARGKSQPGERARLIDNRGNLSINYQGKVYSPYPEPIPVRTTPVGSTYPMAPLETLPPSRPGPFVAPPRSQVAPLETSPPVRQPRAPMTPLF